MPLLFLNSRDGDATELSNNVISWDVKDPKFLTLGSYGVSLLNVEVPNSVYPINRFYCTLKYFETGGSSYTVTIAYGSYTGSSLATAVAVAMTATASAATYTGSYNSDTKKITITKNSGSFYWQAVDNDCYDEMGITTFATAAISQVSDAPVNLAGSNFIDVMCSEIPTDNVSVGSTGRVLARIPLDQNFGYIIYYQTPEALRIPVSMDSLSRLTFSLFDDRGNAWELPNNSHISFVMKIDPRAEPRATSGSLANPDYSSTGVNILENIKWKY